MNYFFLYYYSIYSNLPDANFERDWRASTLMGLHVILILAGLLFWVTILFHVNVAVPVNKFAYFIVFIIFALLQDYYLNHKRNEESIKYYRKNREKVDRVRRIIRTVIYFQAILGMYFLYQIEW